MLCERSRITCVLPFDRKMRRVLMRRRQRQGKIVELQKNPAVLCIVDFQAEALPIPLKGLAYICHGDCHMMQAVQDDRLFQFPIRSNYRDGFRCLGVPGSPFPGSLERSPHRSLSRVSGRRFCGPTGVRPAGGTCYFESCGWLCATMNCIWIKIFGDRRLSARGQPPGLFGNAFEVP